MVTGPKSLKVDLIAAELVVRVVQAEAREAWFLLIALNLAVPSAHL